MPLTDIGANLAHDSFDDDRDAVIERATAAGVQRMVVTGSDHASSCAAVALAHSHAGRCLATAGLHPHHAEDWSEELSALIADAADRGAIAAVGETGLDFFRDISPRAVQERVFQNQLRLAIDHRLPVFLHQRDAHARFLPILRNAVPDLVRVVVHCFTDSAEALDAYLELGASIGITGWICDERRGRCLRDIVPRIPDDRLMIETDCPYLMPRNIRPKPRSRRNEPANLPWVVEGVATARSQTTAHIADITHRNAGRFFAAS